MFFDFGKKKEESNARPVAGGTVKGGKKVRICRGVLNNRCRTVLLYTSFDCQPATGCIRFRLISCELALLTFVSWGKAQSRRHKGCN